MNAAELGPWLSIAGGAAVVALGAFVLTVKPRSAASVWFAVFAIAFGGYFVWNNLTQLMTGGSQFFAFEIPFFGAWAAGVLAMAFLFPRPLASHERSALVIAAAVALAIAGTAAWPVLTAAGIPAALVGHALVASAAGGFLFGYLFLLVLRYRTSTDAAFSSQTVLTAAALTAYVALSAGAGYYDGNSAFDLEGMGLAHALLRLLAMLAVAGMWLAFAHGDDARTGRNMAWFTLGLVLVGLLVATRGGGHWHGLARLFMAGLLAYAVVRHQLLGIDVKLRWTISKSTVAATFIAAFFLASEGAQILFGQGNEWVGLLAAGALVFTLAPLQRAAERLAERAVPLARPTGAGASDLADARGESSYRKAVRLAMRDHRLTREEEGHLHELARDLGLDGARAHEILVEVEREAEAR